LACVDGGNRFLSIERISAPGVPQVFEHRFDANKQDSCGAIAPGTQPYQAWVAGLQNQTLIEMRKGRGGWRVEERTRSYVGAFLHAFVQNRMVGLWGTLSPDNFGVFAFDPKDSRLLLAPSGEDRSADQWVPRGFADDMAVVSNGVFLVQPGKQFITKVELSPTGSQRAQAKIENWKTQLLLPYQIEVTSRCALVLGYLNESGTSAAEWISFESDFRETQVLGSHPEAREGLRYMSLSQGRLFGSDSRGVFEYMDFQIPGQCE
jgi:hypothetical protein